MVRLSALSCILVSSSIVALCQPFSLTVVAGAGDRVLEDYSGNTGVEASRSQFRGTLSGIVEERTGSILFLEMGGMGLLRLSSDNIIRRVQLSADTPALAGFQDPLALAISPLGEIHICDTLHNRVVKISAQGKVTLVAGDGRSHYTGTNAGDGGPATSANLSSPQGIAFDSDSNLYITEANFVRKVNASGIITHFAGGGSVDGDGVPATLVSLNGAGPIAVDTSRNVYVGSANRIRKISPAGVITTIAGNGAYGNGAEDAVATASPFQMITALAVDSSGTIYLAEGPNQIGGRIRRILPDGSVRTIAGAGRLEPRQVGLNPLDLALERSLGISVARSGAVYFTDRQHVFKLQPTSTVCSYSFGSSQVIDVPSAGTGAQPVRIRVTTSPGCLWTTSVSTSWIILSLGAGGSLGSGEVAFSATANPSSTSRTGTLTIAGTIFTIRQRGTSELEPPFTVEEAGAFPQIALGGDWETVLYFTNDSNVKISVPVSFLEDGGEVLSVPYADRFEASFALTLEKGAVQVLPLTSPSGLRQGWMLAKMVPGLKAYSVFRQIVPGREDKEAAAAMLYPMRNQYTLLCDESSGFSTGLSVANPNPTAMNVTIQALDDGARQLGQRSILLGPRSKQAFILRDLNTVGTIHRLKLSSGGLVFAVMGLRFTPNGSFTTIPVY